MNIGNQGTECEHSGPNDSFQDTQKWHGGAENQAYGPTWFRAERNTVIKFRAVSSAPGSTKESPGPGSSSCTCQGNGKGVQHLLHPAAGWSGFSRLHAVTQSKPGGGSLPFGIFWCCPVVLYRKTIKMNIPLYRCSHICLYIC